MQSSREEEFTGEGRRITPTSRVTEERAGLWGYFGWSALYVLIVGMGAMAVTKSVFMGALVIVIGFVALTYFRQRPGHVFWFLLRNLIRGKSVYRPPTGNLPLPPRW